LYDVRVSTTIHPHLDVSHDDIASFCRRWNIVELALFGSVVRDDFRPDSDVDVMLRFAPDAKISLWDLVRVQDELSELFGRAVDVVEFGQITNPYRLRSIERDLTTVYAA
jgi:predicted nucleotidyltransferase